jgi:predicted ATPase
MARTNLGPESSRFVGRQRELAALRATLEEARVVTIVGPPGIGKTRLALRCARVELDARDEVWVVDAQGAQRPGALAARSAEVLGIANDSVARRLAEGGRVLFVIDDVDDDAKTCAALVREIARAAAHARVIVAARSAMRVEGEHRFELGPLGDDGVRLFVERARAVRRAYAPSRAKLRTVAAIVKRLDGNPLAIELAAARLTALSEEQILEMIDETVHGASVLEGAIASSWKQLARVEREALAAFSVFEGGFTLEGARAVLRTSVATALARVEALRERSLVHADEATGALRFGLYESIAIFARKRLTARAEIERRHAAWCIAAGSRWAREVVREGSTDARACLAAERRNLEAIVARAPASENALAALVALDALVVTTGPLAAHAVALDRALARRGSHPLGAAAFLARGYARVRLGEEGARSDLLRARDLARRARDDVTYGRAVVEIGVESSRRGAIDDATYAYEEARRVFHQARERVLEGVTLGHLAVVRHRGGDLDGALAHLEAQMRIARPDDLATRASLEVHLGGNRHERGDLTEARTHYRRALALARRAGALRQEAVARAALGLVHWERGDLERSRAMHERAVVAARALGDRAYEGLCLASLAGVETSAGRLARAERILDDGAALALAVDNARVRGAIDIYRAMLLFARGARTRDARRADELARRARREVARVAADPRAVSEDVRVALRIARARFEGLADDAASELAVDRDGRWFRFSGGKDVSLVRHRVLARLLLALAEHRLRSPGAALSTFDLLAAGWPGQTIAPLAGANRVYVALTALRRLGLRTAIVRANDGYMLDRDVRVAIGR